MINYSDLYIEHSTNKTYSISDIIKYIRKDTKVIYDTTADLSNYRITIMNTIYDSIFFLFPCELKVDSIQFYLFFKNYINNINFETEYF